MKVYLIQIPIVFLITFSFFSCTKHQQKRVEPTSFNKLEVPNDFDWELSQTIDLEVISSKTGVIKVTSEDESVVFHVGKNSNQDEAYKCQFSIPTYVESFKVNGVLTETSNNVSMNLDKFKSANNDDWYIDLGDVYEFEFPDTPIDDYYSEVVGENKIIVGYNNGMNLYATLATVDGLNIIKDRRVIVSPNWGRHFEIAAVSEDKVIFCYSVTNNDFTQAFLKIGTINGTSIEYSDGILITDQNIDQLSIEVLSDGKFIVGYSYSTSGEIFIKVGRLESNVIVFEQALPLNQNVTSDYIVEKKLHLNKLKSNKAIICYLDRDAGNGLSCMIFDNTTNSSLIGPIITLTDGDFSNISIAVMNGNKVVLTDNGGPTSKTYLLGLDGNVISHLGDVVTDVFISQRSSVTKLNDDQFAISFTEHQTNTPMIEWSVVKVGTIQGNNITFSNRKNLNNMYSYNRDLGTNHTIGPNHFYSSFRQWTPGRPISLVVGEYTYGGSNQDTDGDGVSDNDDAFPIDPNKAFINYYPTSSYGTLAFEDLYPYMGDYDFNDVVVDFRFEMYSNSDNLVTDLKVNIVARASGASFENGFGFSFYDQQGILSGNISVTGCVLSEGIIETGSNGLELNQSKPTIIAFDNFFNILSTAGGMGVNTTPGAQFVPYDTICLYFQINTPVRMYDVAPWNWNPFIFVNGNRGHEIHLKNKPSTSLVDENISGTGESSGWGYYTTSTYLPWGLQVPESIDYPTEETDILNAFNHFREWAESGGRENNSWYKDFPGNRNNELLY
ncbi:MAG: LruC domain-containing protein [Bacteroidetes bacterium]|nr:LruC domain-containing protein [Bacteroidota bacterium]